MDYNNKIIAFDLDGTLLNDSRKVSKTDYDSLKKLGTNKHIRVAATGRNCFSVKRLLPTNFPIDFVVFSSGAGIFNWHTKEIIYKKHIGLTDIIKIINTIEPYKLNFTINKPIPNNHHMLLYSDYPESNDLVNYTEHYKDFLEPLIPDKLPNEATQVIVLLNSHRHLFEQFSKQLAPLKAILTTSPINQSSMWMEVFNPEVSKSNGLKWLAEHLCIKNPTYFAIGNDYNDIDMLTFAQESFVVANAPQELKKQFKVSESNNNSGFTAALKTTDFI